MGVRNRPSRYARRRQRDRSWRSAVPPPDHGDKYSEVPSWEREFCSNVGNISWQVFCENKRYIAIFNSLDQWDDSGAFENFQNAKTRYWAKYHGQPSDIPLPDPDMYIDKVDHHCKVDPELVAALDKIRLPIDSDNNSALAIGSADAGADNKCTQNQPGYWDICKTVEVNGWGWEPSPGSNATWGGNDESSNKWANSNSGWDHAVEKTSCLSCSNGQYASNNIYNNFYVGSNNNIYLEDNSNHTSGRKQNGSGDFHKRNKDKGLQRRSWQDPRGRKKEWRPLRNKTCQNGEGIEGGT